MAVLDTAIPYTVTGRNGLEYSNAYALCTPAWVYTHTFFSEPLVTLCLVTAAFSMICFAQRDKWRRLAMGGGAVGVALLTRVDAVAALPAFALNLPNRWLVTAPRLLEAEAP